jgi:hypothetical protein
MDIYILSVLAKKPCLRVSRTVELVDQTKDSWRKEECKMQFVIALGLTPKMDCRGKIKVIYV